MKQIVGTYDRAKEHYGFVVPDNNKLPQDIFVPKEHSKGAMSGHKVVVDITDYGSDRKSPEGRAISMTPAWTSCPSSAAMSCRWSSQGKS